MKRSYDFIAPFYDFLAWLVYGSAVKNAQQFLAQHIPPNSSILVVGGGTGTILEQLADYHKTGLQITYVDSSGKMMKRARRKNFRNNDVVFIQQSVQDFAVSQQFDAVITTFFFDNFSDAMAGSIFTKLHSALSKNGRWLFADFYDSKNIFWQTFLLKIMYRFFRLLCNIEAKQLPAIEPLFEQAGYRLINSKNFFRKFINAQIFVKTN